MGKPDQASRTLPRRPSKVCAINLGWQAHPMGGGWMGYLKFLKRMDVMEGKHACSHCLPCFQHTMSSLTYTYIYIYIYMWMYIHVYIGMCVKVWEGGHLCLHSIGHHPLKVSVVLFIHSFSHNGFRKTLANLSLSLSLSLSLFHCSLYLGKPSSSLTSSINHHHHHLLLNLFISTSSYWLLPPLIDLCSIIVIHCHAY